MINQDLKFQQEQRETSAFNAIDTEASKNANNRRLSYQQDLPEYYLKKYKIELETEF